MGSRAGPLECIVLRTECFQLNFLDDPEGLHGKLANLNEEHRDLDSAIDALVVTGVTDQLKIARLKKRKLILKDKIKKLNNQITPDIIA